jgi:TonB family protein
MVSFLLEEQGTTGFRLTVDATGKVTGRTVTRSSGFSRLDDLTCKVVSRRARFAPAQDRSGTPVTAHYSQRVIWKTASDDPMPARMFGWSRPAEAKKLKLRGKVRFEATVGEDGKVQDCRKVRSSGAALLDGETCKRLRELEETSVKRDESGVAVSRQVTGWIEW